MLVNKDREVEAFFNVKDNVKVVLEGIKDMMEVSFTVGKVQDKKCKSLIPKEESGIRENYYINDDIGDDREISKVLFLNVAWWFTGHFLENELPIFSAYSTSQMKARQRHGHGCEWRKLARTATLERNWLRRTECERC